MKQVLCVVLEGNIVPLLMLKYFHKEQIRMYNLRKMLDGVEIGGFFYKSALIEMYRGCNIHHHHNQGFRR